MEEISKHQSPFEEDDEESDAKPKKRSRSALEAYLKTPTDKDKEKVGKDIAKSLFELPFKLGSIKDESPKEQTEAVKQELSPDSSNLSAEEETYINQALAGDHLASPTTGEAPTAAVIDFLGKVQDGTAPEEAYSTILGEHNLVIEEDTNQESQAESNYDDLSSSLPDVHPYTERLSMANDLSVPVVAYDRPLSRAINNRQERVVMSSPAVAPTKLAKEITEYLIIKRESTKLDQKNQKNIEREVNQLEAKLSSKERTIQRLTHEGKARTIAVAVTEKNQPGLSESRMNLMKPIQAERLGKVIIAAEHPSIKIRRNSQEKMVRPNNLRDYFRAEDVKTMRRVDLMVVSEKVVVDGASLKTMYENNLFSERALRRLVADYLQGKDIKPRLRRELVEREIDFERDPLLRDQNRTTGEDDNKSIFFQQLLASVDLSKPEPSDPSKLQQAREKQAKKKQNQNVKQAKSINATRVTSASSVLATIILLLSLLIIYLLLHRT